MSHAVDAAVNSALQPLGTPTAARRWIVGNGLPGVVPEAEVSIEELSASLGWAAKNRLIGLLFAAAGGVGEEVPGDIAEVCLTTLRQGLAVEVEACRAVATLTAAGLGPIVFKGVASAHLDYPAPGNRTFYDVDLLVEREAFGAAAEHLATCGWTRIESPLGPKWEARFGRSAQFLAPSGVEVDLHAALAAGYFGVRLDYRRLRQATETFQLGGVEAITFDADARLLTSCYALVLSRGGSVRLVRDVAQQVLGSGASWKRAGLLAGEGNVVIAAALNVVDRWVGLTAEALEWARNVLSSATPSQRRGLSLAADAHARRWRGDVAGELLGLGVPDRIRYASGVGEHRMRSAIRRGDRS
jgi:hypothetical protein